MKKLFSIVACFAITILRGQELSSIGSYSTHDFQITDCEFDKGANAMVLVDEARSDYNEVHNLVTVHHIKIKILKEKGLENANIDIPFYSRDAFEYIDDVHAITINMLPNGNIETRAVDAKSIYTEKTSPYWSRIKFTFPAVAVGSVLEYTYRSTMKHYGGLDKWVFQWEIPVERSTYDLVILPNAEFAYQVQRNPEYPIDITSNKEVGSVKFEMRNIPGLTDEPYMDARGDYEQKVKFQWSAYSGNGYTEKIDNTWPDLAKSLLREDMFGGQLDKSLEGTSEFIRDTKAINSEIDRMRRVYDYVRAHMDWNGRSWFRSLDGIKSGWKQHTGISADVNLALINLLKAVDLNVDPMLVSEREHGKVNTSYPFVDQFNSVYAAVSVNGRHYYLDATNKYLPWNITPYEILNTTAFIVNKKNAQLINIQDDAFKFDERVFISGAINNDGVLNGNANVLSSNYARVIKLGRYKSDHERFIETYFKKGNTGISIDSFKTEGMDQDSLPFTQNFQFRMPVTITGDYYIIDLNLFAGEKTNPFLLENRFSNINFGYRQRILLNAVVELPSGFAVDALPKPMTMVTPDRSVTYQRSVSVIEGKLTQGVLIEVNRSLFTADDYSTVKEFYKKMYQALNEKIVLKKK